MSPGADHSLYCARSDHGSFGLYYTHRDAECQRREMVWKSHNRIDLRLYDDPDSVSEHPCQNRKPDDCGMRCCNRHRLLHVLPVLSENPVRKAGNRFPRKNYRTLLNAFLLCVWAVVIVLCICFRKSLTPERIAGMTPANSFLAALVLLALFALKSPTVVIYAPLLYAVSGLLFPLPAAITINLVGTLIMVTIWCIPANISSMSFLSHPVHFSS